MKAFKVILMSMGVLFYLSAVVLWPVPVLGLTLAGGVIWFIIWNNEERNKNGQ